MLPSVRCSSQDTALSLPESPWQLPGTATAVPGTGPPYVTRDKHCHAWESTGCKSGFVFAKQTNSFPNIPTLAVNTLTVPDSPVCDCCIQGHLCFSQGLALLQEQTLPFLAQFREFNPSSCLLERPSRTLCSENSETLRLDSTKRKMERAEEQTGLLLQSSVQGPFPLQLP